MSARRAPTAASLLDMGSHQTPRSEALLLVPGRPYNDWTYTELTHEKGAGGMKEAGVGSQEKAGGPATSLQLY